jgi:hypothetical protein
MPWYFKYAGIIVLALFAATWFTPLPYKVIAIIGLVAALLFYIRFIDYANKHQ